MTINDSVSGAHRQPRTALEQESSLIEATRLVGFDHRGARTTIEITDDNVRDYCNYIGSANPLYRNSSYGRRSRWGRALAPPTMVGTAVIAPGLRGVQWIYGGARWRFPRLFGPGDVLAQTGHLVGAEIKRGRNANMMVMQRGVTRCTNQRGESVVDSEVFCMRVPRRGASGGLNYAPREARWTDDDIAGFIERATRQRDLVRGADIRYWDDVSHGDAVPEVLYGPLRLSDVALTRGCIVFGIVGGRPTDGGFGYMLDHYRRHPADVFENPESGVAEHPHRGHWEQYMAREVGMPGIYDVGYQRLGWLTRVVTDWMGDDGRLLAIEGWLRRPNIVGDITLISGVVKSKHLTGEDGVVKLALSAKNQDGEETMVGKAEVELLVRQPDMESPT